jgi:VWFA-related protein
MISHQFKFGLALFASFGISVAQSGQTPNGEDLTPAMRAMTRLVIADVIVTDRSGQRVGGLSQDDFTILENGKPQKISVFTVESRHSGPASQGPALPQNVYTNRPEYDMPTGPPTVMLLDGLNTPVADQGYARYKMLTYLDSQIQPGQPIAVYTLAGSLRLLQGFTDNLALLKAAVEHFTPQTSVEMQIEDVKKSLPSLHATGDTGVHGGGSGPDNLRRILSRMSEFTGEQTRYAIGVRVERTIAALEVLSKRMAGYPGRKNLIWVSAGFPMEITSQIVQLTTDRDVVAEGTTATDPGVRVEKSYEESLRRLGAELSDAQMAVYSVDARGLVGSGTADASRQGTNAAGFLQTGSEYGAEVARSSGSVESTQDTLLTLAAETGGLTFKNQNDISGAVASSLADGSSYYLLGYYPESKQWDGKFRKIQVKINKPGVEVRHRTGYFAKDPMGWGKNKEKNDPELNSAMNMGAPQSTMVIFDSRVVPPAASSKMQVPVEFLVNPRSLTGEQMKDGGLHYSLEFHVAAYSADGKLVAHKDTGMDAPVKADRVPTFLQQGIPFKTEIELGPGQYWLRLAVRDGRTGYIGSTEIPLTLASK